MRSKLLVIFLTAIFFSLGIISALSCSITTSCNSANRLMALSSSTNAHGEVYNAGYYSYYVCCDETIGHTCDGTNKVVGLSSTTNAHAEIPSLDTYGTDVCFEGYTCTSRTTCNSDETAIMSLSSTTNAHIGGASYYIQKICCKKGAYAFWSENGNNEITILEGINLGVSYVYLVLNNSGLSQCTNCVNFEIYEDDASLDDDIRTGDDAIKGSVDENGKATATWVITQDDIDNSIHPLEGDFETDDIYEFYFEVEGETSNNLDVTVGSASICSLISAYWEKSNAIEEQEVGLYVQGTSACDGREVSFEVKEDDGAIGDDDVETNPSNVFFSGSSAIGIWTAEWPDTQGETNPTYYFNAELVTDPSENVESEEPMLSVTSSEQCIGIGQCMNYETENECNSDMCSVGVNSVEANNPDVSCGTTYNILTQCNEMTDCGCEWNSTTSVCQPAYEEIISSCEGEIPVSSIGACSYNENSQDNCDDGILTYSWSAQWGWGELNDFGTTCPEGDSYYIPLGDTQCRYDPTDLTGKRKSEKCVGGENSVSCPAQIQLPFFNLYTAIATILVIVLIYIIINSNCKTKKKKQK